MNRVILVGRMVADPELKQTPNNLSVCSFSIAVNRNYSKNGGQQADFINIVAWRSQAEIVAKYFHKGNQIGIDGSIQTRQYTDKNGNKRTAFEVLAENISFIEKKADMQGGNANEPSPTSSVAAVSVDVPDEDLPF